MAKNLLISHFRKIHWDNVKDIDLNPDKSFLDNNRQENKQYLFQILSAINKKHSRVLEALYFEGLTVKQIAGQKKRGSGIDQELAGINRELQLFQGKTSKIGNQLDLRLKYLSGALSARQVSIKEHLASALSNLKVADLRYQMVSSQMKRLKDLAAKGMISVREIRYADYEIFVSSAQLRLAQLEYEILKKADL